MIFVLCEYSLRCEIFGFVSSFPQNKRKIYKLRQLSLSDFVYFLREACLLFIFWMIKFTIMSKNPFGTFIIQKLKSKHTSLKKYTNWDKLSCLSLYIFSRFEGTRGDKNQIFRNLVSIDSKYFHLQDSKLVNYVSTYIVNKKTQFASASSTHFESIKKLWYKRIIKMLNYGSVGL